MTIGSDPLRNDEMLMDISNRRLVLSRPVRPARRRVGCDAAPGWR